MMSKRSLIMREFEGEVDIQPLSIQTKQKEQYIPTLPKKPPQPRMGEWKFCVVCWQWIIFEDWFKHIGFEKDRHGEDIYERIQKQRKKAQKAINKYNSRARGTTQLSDFVKEV